MFIRRRGRSHRVPVNWDYRRNRRGRYSLDCHRPAARFRPGELTSETHGREQHSMFLWDTIKEIAPHDLQYQGNIVPGTMNEIELTSGVTIRVWRTGAGHPRFLSRPHVRRSE